MRRTARTLLAGFGLPGFGLAGFGLLLLAGCDPAARAGGANPSIVVVTIDTLRADHLGCYGYFRDTSPVIDALSADSRLFTRAVTTMSTTLPAHVSLWSSRYPLQTGVTTNGSKLVLGEPGDGPRIRLFAQMLQGAGYRTAAFVSATPVKKYTGIDAGFDHFDEPDKKGPGRGGRADETTDAVLAWLETPPDEPFFLWVHYFDPHSPYDPPPPYDTRFETDDGLRDFLYDLRLPYPDDPEVLEVNNLYDGEILFTDVQVGRLIGRLKELGLYDDATVVLASDHGEGLGQHGRLGHGEIYNEQLLVPLMIKFPRALGLAGRHDRLVSLVDVVPTLVETLGIDLSEKDRAQFVGINVLAEERRYALVQRSTHKRRRYNQQGHKYALVGQEWKYTYRTDGTEELFDLRTDPGETVSLSPMEQELTAELKDALMTRIAEYSASEQGLEVVRETSPEIVEELRALGYLQ